MTRFKDKVCVVTGGAKGIGEATARRMAAEGGAVMILDLKYEEAQAAADQLIGAGGFAQAYACDVADEAAVRDVFAQIETHHGRIDVLVNNAGTSGPSGPIENIALADWRALLAVNLDGVFLCTREALRLMKATGGGAIVNISSIYGLVGSADAAAYHASKGAVRLLTKATALQVAKLGIRVNSVHPGFIDTPLVQDYADRSGQHDQVLAGLVALHPIGRLGRSEEVAAVIAFLASDDASFMTGSEVVVDGGYTAQ
ncbi:SDR family oxidoreductase [Deinococcus detaillensis]|uniref:SDR family oxidoreductase n=1 Tax=Deinococcus detaillensis TaxID=2592048 RepID=A0A553UZ26_9DEIO|nr:SDR family NAD(P)-dependent oxidoreductase [Deinococcus detaillensis]TSA85473.1 SDR family oxidoreductase [Deinococcus detaillensis]